MASLVRLSVVLAGGLLLAFAVWDRGQFEPPIGICSTETHPCTLLFTDLMAVVTPALAAAASLLAARHARGPSRLAWGALFAGCTSWAVGGVLWTYYNFATGEAVPFPSLADVGYLGFIPLAAVGILAFPSAPLPHSRWMAALDGAMVAGALLFLSWATFLGPVAAAQQAADGTWLATSISLAYPIGDAMLLTVLLVAGTRASSAARAPLYWVAAGLAGITVSDAVFAFTQANGTYGIGQTIATGWVAGFLLIGIGAMSSLEAPVSPASREELPSRWRSALPLLPVVASTFMAMRVEVTRGYLEPVLFWLALVVVSMAVGRQFITVLLERRLALEEAAALQKARQAENARIQLINNIAHDVGTPLTPILLQLRLLENRRDQLPEDVHHSLDVVRRNAQHLKALLADFLDVARMEAGRLRLVPGPMDLAATTRSSVESFQEHARQRGVALELDAPPQLALEGDGDRILQVLYNLLTNALKFTPAGGHVAVRLRSEPGWAVVDVVDNGRGWQAGQEHQLCKPFSQLQTDGPLAERGTGLGLYISRGILERHGGAIDGFSPGPGLGATFRFRLPLHPPAIAEGARAAAQTAASASAPALVPAPPALSGLHAR